MCNFLLDLWHEYIIFATLSVNYNKISKHSAMLFRKLASYIEEYYKNSRNALLLTGARQTGKTYSIRNFGRFFKSFIEINFIENPEAIEIFSKANSASEILNRMSLFVDKPFIKNETLVFFDEVQECPNLITALKFLVEEGSYRYILSGSLLGVELKDIKSEPVGFMGIKEVFPLTLEEFYSNIGVNDNIFTLIEESWRMQVPMDSVIHNKLIEAFRLYLIVGGMPAAVDEYVKSNNLRNVINVQKDIIALYKRDISKYSVSNKLTIKEIYDLIPSELDAKNKRFILKSLREHSKYERYKDSFLWLKDAGVALPVYNVAEPKIPLKLSEQRNLFKLFCNDVGLLAAQYADGIQLRLLEGDGDINFGAVYENAVAQELYAQNHDVYYYNNKKLGELDFIITLNQKVLPIEIKSGKSYNIHRALLNILDNPEFDISEGYVFCNGNVEKVGKILYAPIYMIMMLKFEDQLPLHYKIDFSSL